jgi:hypothetical protein
LAICLKLLLANLSLKPKMSDVEYTNFVEENLRFERNSLTVKDKETGRDVIIPQLLFNYIDPEAPVAKMPADGKRRARFVIQGPRMKTKGTLTARDGKAGSKNYSLFQGYDEEIPEQAEWVRVNRTITNRLVNELADKDVKSWMKHTHMRSTLPSLVPCAIYQKTVENDDGVMGFEPGSKPSSYFNFFEAMTREGKPFGTRVRIHGSRTDLTKQQWVKLLSENTIEYTPFVSYQRCSFVGGNFRLVTQLDMLVIHEATPYERKTGTDLRVEKMGITAEDEARAKRIEAMLLGNSDSGTSYATESENPPSHVSGTHADDW